jgi:hypothetical protein
MVLQNNDVDVKTDIGGRRISFQASLKEILRISESTLSVAAEVSSATLLKIVREQTRITFEREEIR